MEHHHGKFFFITNKDGARNNKLVVAPVAAYFPESEGRSSSLGEYIQWVDVRTYDASEQIEEVLPFKDHVAIFGRKRGVQQLWIMSPEMSGGDREWREVQFPEPIYSVWAGPNCEFDSSSIRLGYSSPVTPKQVLDLDMTANTFTLR